MDEITLPLTEFEFELDAADLAKATPPTPSYIISKRVAQGWLAKETAWDRQEPLSILDLAAGEGEFSDIICDHAETPSKSALWVDIDADLMSEGIARVDGAFKVETIVSDLNDDLTFAQLSGRSFDRIAFGLLHHHIDSDRYRNIVSLVASDHLKPNGTILIVELCAGMYPEVTRDMVLPNLLGSIPDNVHFVANTPKLVRTPVRNNIDGRTWSIEFFCAALAANTTP